MSNVKSDASKLPDSSDQAEILKQVEFYFSDENLPTDKFLWKTSQANNGWVPISTIHNFKRMRRFQPEDAVIEALQSSEVLEVEDGKVRRKTPLKEPNPEEKKSAFARTVYAKGFGAETETTQFDVEKFFGEFGETKQVRLRRADDGTFKGSVFVEFADASDSDKFLAASPKWNDEELLVMSKQAYTDMKAAEHGFSNNANGKRRRFNAFKEKPKRQQNRRQQPNKRQQNKRPRNDENEESAKKAKSEADAEGNADAETGAKPAATLDEKPEVVAEPVEVHAETAN